MFLAPRRQHGDHTKAHREEAGGEEVGGEEDLSKEVLSKEVLSQKELCEKVPDQEARGEVSGGKEACRTEGREEDAGRAKSRRAHRVQSQA